jgi:hypothetical protein
MQATIRQQVIYPLKCPQQELLQRNTPVLCSMSQNIHCESEIVIQNYGQTCLKASLGYDYDFFETPHQRSFASSIKLVPCATFV